MDLYAIVILFNSELVKDYRALSKTIRDLERKVRDLYAKSYDLAQARGEVMSSRRRSGARSDGEKEVLAVKRAQKLQKVSLNYLIFPLILDDCNLT